MEFSFDFYKDLLTELKQYFEFSSFSKYSEKNKVFLRHDVDIFPENIFKLIAIEKQIGVRSIIFFQPNCSFYNMLSPEIREIIHYLGESGFEIGLHIDAAELPSKAAIEKEVSRLFDFYSGYYEISRIISFHRPPERVLRNLKINGFINTYEDRFFKDIRYFADSNRRPFYDQMKKSLKEDKETSIQLVVHPYWWDFEHLDIQGLFTRLFSSHISNSKNALARGTKIYNKFFSRRML